MSERKEGKVCKEVAENIRELVEISLEYFGEVPDSLVKILRKGAKDDQEIHEKFRGTSNHLDIYDILSKARTLSDTGG